MEKQGVKSINIMREDSRFLSDYLKFDKILLDAPCSGSGTENVFEPKFTLELIKRSSKTQEELLRKALKIVKKGGEIVYSTCSILEEENEDVLNKLKSEFNFEIEKVELPSEIETLPSKLENTKIICPSKLYEGFFISKIKKI